MIPIPLGRNSVGSLLISLGRNSVGSLLISLGRRQPRRVELLYQEVRAVIAALGGGIGVV